MQLLCDVLNELLCQGKHVVIRMSLHRLQIAVYDNDRCLCDNVMDQASLEMVIVLAACRIAPLAQDVEECVSCKFTI